MQSPKANLEIDTATKKEVNELLESNQVNAEPWVKHLTELFKGEINTGMAVPDNILRNDIIITPEDVEEAVRSKKQKIVWTQQNTKLISELWRTEGNTGNKTCPKNLIEQKNSRQLVNKCNDNYI